MRRSAQAAETFAEKEFYLDEFHDKSLLVALRAADWVAEPAQPAVLEVLTTLLRNDTRLVLLLETGQGAGEQRRVTALANRLARGGHTPVAAPVELALGGGSVGQRGLELWGGVRRTRLAGGVLWVGAPVWLGGRARRGCG